MRYLFSIAILSVLACGFSEHGSKDHRVLVSHFDSTVTKDKNSNTYSWLKKYDEKNSIFFRILPGQGYNRKVCEPGSFGNWLRFVELKEGSPPVHLYNGELKENQLAQFAVINMDVGTKDLQQCADAVMRMRAEYLFSIKKYDQIHFNYTSGDKVSFSDWCKGRRPVIKGSKVMFFTKWDKVKPTYEVFREYMDNIFNYCGTLSLSKEMKSISLKDIEPGDVFIYGGSPGHAVLVMDVAINKINGDKEFLIAQSYMPAQEMHVLKNPSNNEISPWYSISEITDRVTTPEWTFKSEELKRFQ